MIFCSTPWICLNEKCDTILWAPINSSLENGTYLLTKSEDQSNYPLNESKIDFGPHFNSSFGIGVRNYALFIDQRITNSTPIKYKRIFGEFYLYDGRHTGSGYMTIITDTRETIALYALLNGWVMFFKEKKSITYCEYQYSSHKVSLLYRNSVQY